MFRFQLLLWSVLALCSSKIGAQTDEKVLNCAVDELHEQLRIDKPEYRKREEKLEMAWSAYAKREQKSSPPPYTIPIVFHIVHENGPENISDADIIRSLEFTNQAFANTDYYDQGTGVNTGVQFCLAQRTPDNLTTSGINRIVSPEFTDVEATAEDRALKDLSRWEPREYVNVWVVKEICGLGFGCGVAGYAYYPGAHGGPVDGIVVEARWLTTNEARASVLVHELGHYLGIRHTFDGGCTNDDCTLDGDRVCDTPPDQSKAAVPCSGTANSCSTDINSGFATDQNDMFINYMDYGYWSCYSAFTQGQADRMHFFLDGTRRSLLDSPGCSPPCPAPVTADFSGGDITVEIGTTINFLNGSTNGNGYTWDIDNLPVATSFNYSHLFDTEGNFTVTLLAGGSPPLCRPDSMRQRVRVVCSLTSAFDASGASVQNVERTFTNQSTLATDYEWRLDGNLISTDQDLTYTFPSPGLFNLCLQASNPWCGREYCRLVFVNPPTDTTSNPTGDCGASFTYGYQSPFGEGQDGSFTTVIPDENGGYYAAGYYGRQSLVMHLAADGSVLWQSQLFSSNNGATVTKLVLDEDGNLAGIGTNNTTSAGTVPIGSFIFQMDPTNGNIRWSHNLLLDFGQVKISDFTQAASGAPYTIVGNVSSDAATGLDENGFILQLNANDGLALGGLRLYFSESPTTFDRIIWHRNQNQFYVSGKELSANNPGWLLMTFDAGAGLQQGTLIPTTDPTNTTNALAQDGDFTIFASSSLNSSGALNDLTLYRFDAMGIPDISIVLSTLNLQILTNLETNATGYLIQSLSTTGQILTQVDRLGTSPWARSYDLGLRSSVGFNFHPSAITANDGILIAGDRFGGTGQIPTVLRLQPDGSAAADCIDVFDYALTPLPRQPDLTDWFAQAEDVELNYQDFGSEPASLVPAGGNCRGECPDQDDCSAPFFFGYDEGDNFTAGGFTAVVTSGENKYVGGSINGRAYVAALATDGSIIWQSYFNLNTNSSFPDVIADLIIDSDGQLVGIGRKMENADDRAAFIFRINPDNGLVLWNRGLPSGLSGIRHSFSNLFQPSPGSDYLVTGSFATGDVTSLSAGATYRFDPASGALTNNIFNVYHSNLSRGFEGAAISANGEILFALANRPQGGGEVVVITAIDLITNTVLWSNAYDQPSNASGRLFGYSLALHNNQLVVLASGNGETDDAFYLLQTDLTGDNPSLTEYALGSFFSVSQVASFNNNIAVTGDFANGQYLTLINETDGTVAVARNYFGYNEFDNRANSFRVNGEQLLLAGRLFSMGGALLAVDSLGLPVQNCSPSFEGTQYSVQMVAVQQMDIPQVVSQRGQVQPFDLPPTEPANLLLNPASCPADCEEDPPVEICDNLIDDDGDGFVDCQDEDLALDCCCLPDPNISMGSDQDFCGPVLRNFTAVRFDSLFLTGVRNDTLYPDPIINGLIRLTFTEPGVYLLRAVDTCGRFAFDTLTLHPRTRPDLEIGPDTILCSNAVIPLRAQPGFETYEWVDGTPDREFTAFEAGTYWVKATDSCGTVQSDTMRVIIDPASTIDLGPDTLICPGDTLTFSLTGFSNYQWSQSSFIDCDNCPTVRFAPTSDTLLLVAAEQGPGCIASDSIRVRMADISGGISESTLCSGDTLTIGSQTITLPGQYFDTIPSGNCYRVDTVIVHGLQDTVVRDTIVICAGDSTLIFDDLAATPGTYSNIFPRNNGCDSLQEILLVINDTFLTTQTISICAGDSVAIFGQFETEAGAYFSFLSTANGCDSTLRVDLEVNNIAISTIVTSDACAGADAGAGEVLISNGLAPFTIAWSSGTLTPQITDLAAGEYTVTVTDANGCSATDSLVISAVNPPVLTLSTTDESCPGASDGSLLVSGDLSGQTLSIPGVDANGPDFTGLPPGDYVLEATDSLGCDQSIPFTINPAATALLSLPASFELNFGDSLTIIPTTTATDLSDLIWSTGSTILCTGCPQLTLQPTSDLEVIATLPDLEGCPVTDTTHIRVSRENLVYIPTAFSPNADGVNDAFRIYPNGAVTEILRFAVFDRWGGQVFLRENVAPGDALAEWDGTLPTGRDPSIGVYVYLVEVRLFNGEVIKLAREVMVLR